MKRNMDLIMFLLEQVENLENESTGVLVDSLMQRFNMDNDNLNHQLNLIRDQGFILYRLDLSPAGQAIFGYLTWKGHDYLDSHRNKSDRQGA